MAILIACEHCDTLFWSNVFGGSATVHFQNCRTDCLSCGRMTAIADGTYELANSTVTAVHGLSVKDVLRFRDLLTKAQAGAASKAAVVAEAEALDPTFGRVVAALQAVGGLPLLVALIALYIQWASS